MEVFLSVYNSKLKIFMSNSRRLGFGISFSAINFMQWLNRFLYLFVLVVVALTSRMLKDLAAEDMQYYLRVPVISHEDMIMLRYGKFQMAILKH